VNGPGEQLRPESSGRAATWAHATPFVAWLTIMSVLGLEFFGEFHPWKYALRTGICLLLLLAFRPWRWYEPIKLKNLPLAVGAGVAVLVIWVAPEAHWTSDMPAWQEFYLRFCVLPLGRLPQTGDSVFYAPRYAGWTYTLVRLAGSAFVIAVIEEFFWRGFLYRWIINRDFLKVSLAKFDWEALAFMGIMFGIEHNRWLAGVLAGLVYLGVLLKTRDIWAAVFAHVVTNFLLGIYVVCVGDYVFW
jgi:CAAX prenyl protease-like protein